MVTAAKPSLGRSPSDSYLDGDRDLILYTNNETPSYIPNCFLGDGKEKLAEKLHSLPVTLLLRKEELTDDSTPLLALATQLEEAIKNHFEVRLQLFHFQCMIAYRSNLVFGKFKTKAQAGVKKEKSEPDSPSKKFPSKYQEAHASTLPNLQYIPQEEYAEVDLSKIEPRILALGTRSYLVFNTTHKLPAFVNSGDLEIDKNIKLPFFDNFRHFCIKILNDLSMQNKLTFMGCYRNFLNNIRVVVQMGKAAASKSYQRKVFTYYEQVVDSYLSKVDQPLFWKTLAYAVKSIKGPLDEVQLQPLTHAIKEQITFEMWVGLIVEQIRDRSVALHPGIKFREDIVRVAIIHLASSGPVTFKVRKILQDSYSDVSKGIKEYAQKCMEFPRLIEAAQTFLEDFEKNRATLEESHLLKKSAFSDEIKGVLKKEKGISTIVNVEKVAARFLLEVSVASYKETPQVVNFCRYFMMSPSRVEELYSEGTTQFKEYVNQLTWDDEAENLFHQLRAFLSPLKIKIVKT